MKHDHSPLRTGHRLTPELSTIYVARARDERAKAISAFGRQVIAALPGLPPAWSGGGGASRPVPLDRADLLTR